MLHIEELEIESNDSVSFFDAFLYSDSKSRTIFFGGLLQNLEYHSIKCPGQMKSIASEIGGDIYMNAV